MISDNHPITFTDRMRRIVSVPLNAAGGLLFRLGIHPDVVTSAGLIVVAVAAWFIAQGELQTGGLILLVGLPLDALDGAVARAMRRKGQFGAVLDSTLDRYADCFIFAALSYHFAVQERFEMFLLAQAALMGSYGVSYVRARADQMDVSVKVQVGIFTRLERLAVILAMLLMPSLLLIPEALDIGMLILAMGTNITTLQRLWFVYRTLKKRGE